MYKRLVTSSDGGRFLSRGVSNFALFRVPSLAVFSTLMCVGPIYALPLSYYIKGEKVTARAVVGSVMPCVGVIPMFFGRGFFVKKNRTFCIDAHHC